MSQSSGIKYPWWLGAQGFVGPDHAEGGTSHGVYGFGLGPALHLRPTLPICGPASEARAGPGAPEKPGPWPVRSGPVCSPRPACRVTTSCSWSCHQGVRCSHPGPHSCQESPTPAPPVHTDKEAASALVTQFSSFQWVRHRALVCLASCGQPPAEGSLGSCTQTILLPPSRPLSTAPTLSPTLQPLLLRVGPHGQACCLRFPIPEPGASAF